MNKKGRVVKVLFIVIVIAILATVVTSVFNMHSFNEAVKNRPMITGATIDVDLVDCSGDECIVEENLVDNNETLEKTDDFSD
jgi:hypothetical protein